MKTFKLILVLALLSVSANAQNDTFKLTKETPELLGQYVVIKKDSLSVEELQKRVVEWVNVSYNSPEDVIKSNMEGKYTRINGINERLGYSKMMGMGTYIKGRYHITFKYKEGKIKMQITSIETYAPPSPYGVSGWMDENISTASTKRKNGKTIKRLVDYNNTVLKSFNDLRNSLESYIDSPTQEQINDSDW